MKVYRLALTQYCDASGEGAKTYGGRWNLPGTPAVYAGSSVSASFLERLTIDPELLSSERYIRYSVMEISIPDHLIFTPKTYDLPLNWNQIPAVRASMEFGTQLLNSGILCFAVPSVVDPSSLNYVVNPLSENFSLSEFRVYPLELDKRLLR
ncbi:RES family NAD+ phosphorylase [Algoriphagus boritolerans]|uniref:RES domain-containing protein n=1 Tax=Algoriphagus boritolerans DSM 17298 = JCM 18970 TaxID=1120964 RepID=A0A1H5X6F8_9BACT|nr:RES family NAD+ phosphorylase [Algoriphagus boritolerans]SEG06866.1 RES domain-containing protein [Algoriphagus boritolerans DSM 17298 = JCM 18970]